MNVPKLAAVVLCIVDALVWGFTGYPLMAGGWLALAAGATRLVPAR